MAYYREIGQDGKWYGNIHLFQKKPRLETPYNPNRPYSVCSWTSSLASRAKAARKESCCLFNNGRRAKFILQLNLFRTYLVSDIPQLRKELDRLFAYLRRKKNTVAYVVLEVTRGKQKTKPTDKVHLHFLIDTELTESALRNLFHGACAAAKYMSDDYSISSVKNIAGKPDHEYCRICRYIVKDGYSDKIVMFKSGLGLRKIRTIGRWWTDKDGTPTKKEEIWAPIRLATIRKYQSQNATPQSLPSANDATEDLG